MIEWILVLVLLVCVLIIGYLFGKRAEVAPTIAAKRAELEKAFEQWKENMKGYWEEQVKLAREDAVARSRASLGGKFVEQLAPYLPEFRYDPTEARFIGSPIDLIIFPGLSKRNPEEIVIMEVKTGKGKKLSKREEQIKELVEKKKVRWELISRPAPQE